MLRGSSDSPISLTPASLHSAENHTIQALDSFPRVPLSSSTQVWPGCARDAAFPTPAVFPWDHTICCSLASPEGEDVVFPVFFAFLGIRAGPPGRAGPGIVVSLSVGMHRTGLCSGLGDAGAGISRSRDSVLMWGVPASSLHQLLPKILRED